MAVMELEGTLIPFLTRFTIPVRATYATTRVAPVVVHAHGVNGTLVGTSCTLVDVVAGRSISNISIFTFTRI